MKTPPCCPITGKPMRQIFTARVLARHDVEYFYSEESGVIQTEKPYWLDEAYESVISKLDTWGAARNFSNCRRLEPILALLFPKEATFVDAGCGYGLLVRCMRDIGFNFYGYDKFCANLFSEPFPPPVNVKASAVFAFEVLEHVTNPVEFIKEQMQAYHSDTFIGSTSVFNGKIPERSWPYYSFESGQHITIYQERSLRLVAETLGCRYFRLGTDLHLITSQIFPAWKLALLSNTSFQKILRSLTRFVRRHESFTNSDYEFVQQRILAGKSLSDTDAA